jgi:hypothetical protein
MWPIRGISRSKLSAANIQPDGVPDITVQPLCDHSAGTILIKCCIGCEQLAQTGQSHHSYGLTGSVLVGLLR